MARNPGIAFVCLFMLISLTSFERAASAADVEAVGELKVSEGIRFSSDNSLQTKACTGCANGILTIDLGGTGGNTATEARENLAVPGLITPNTFTASQSIQGDVTVSGNLSLPATTSTTGIIKSGSNRLIHTFGSGNFFAGINAGNLVMTGSENTATGDSALNTNTTGTGNTATGYKALFYNNGNNNTANGDYALYSNTTGNNNTSSGVMALNSNTSGSSNTANGLAALFFNSNGVSNTASGYYALYSNTSGGYNTASGRDALSSSTTGYASTAIGAYALKSSTTGRDNSAFGYYSLFSNTTGNYNTAHGDYALRYNTTGSYNTAVGFHAGELYQFTGSSNTYLGSYTDANNDGLTNATALGNYARVDASNHVRIGNTNVTQIGGQVAWSNLSDIRTKKDIEEIGFGLDFIKTLRPVQFRMKYGNDRIDFGFIAQDIEALIGDD